MLPRLTGGRREAAGLSPGLIDPEDVAGWEELTAASDRGLIRGHAEGAEKGEYVAMRWGRAPRLLFCDDSARNCADVRAAVPSAAVLDVNGPAGLGVEDVQAIVGWVRHRRWPEA